MSLLEAVPADGCQPQSQEEECLPAARDRAGTQLPSVPTQPSKTPALPCTRLCPEHLLPWAGSRDPGQSHFICASPGTPACTVGTVTLVRPQ